jgi:hypothetical protein
MSEAEVSPPHMPSWHAEGQLHLYLNAEFVTLSLSVSINLNYISKQVTLIVTILVHWMLLSPDNDSDDNNNVDDDDDNNNNNFCLLISIGVRLIKNCIENKMCVPFMSTIFVKNFFCTSIQLITLGMHTETCSLYSSRVTITVA